LKQEEEELKEYQIKQESKLVEQLQREKIALDERVEANKIQLEKEVIVFLVVIASVRVYCCTQMYEESAKLQNARLERQRELQKKQLKELREFAEAAQNDHISLHSENSFTRLSSDRASNRSGTSASNISVGMANVWWQQAPPTYLM